MSMEYIERYLYRIGKLLPKEEEEEVINELREILEDEVNNLQGNNISPKDLEKNQLAVLKNFGRPEFVAAKYGGGIKPLIPAELMPSFYSVLKILLVVYAILFVLIGFTRGNLSLDFFGSFIQTGITNFGILVLIFFLIGRKGNTKDIGKEWSPKDLKPVPGKEKVKQWDLIISVAANSFVLIFITLFPGYIGFGFDYDGEWNFVPVTLNFLEVFLPFISLWLMLRIFVDVYVLQKERWSPAFLWLDIVVGALGIVLAVAIYNYGISVELGTDDEKYRALIPLLNKISIFVIGAMILGLILGIGKRVITLARIGKVI